MELEEGIKAIDKRSQELIKEFHKHYEEARKQIQELVDEVPQMEDKELRKFLAVRRITEHKGDIFEAWAIQKIAGVQILLETINNKMGILGELFRAKYFPNHLIDDE